MKKITLYKKQAYWNKRKSLWKNSEKGVILCGDTLERYYCIPKKADEIDLIISDRKIKDAWHSKLVETELFHLKVENRWNVKIYPETGEFLKNNYPNGCWVRIEY